MLWRTRLQSNNKHWIHNITKILSIFRSEPDLELIPLTDLQDWLHNQAKTVIKESKISLTGLIQKLKDRRWLLECYLDEWEDKLKLDLNSKISSETIPLLKETRIILEQITFAENLNYERILNLSTTIETEFDKLIKKIEKSRFYHDYTAFVPDREREKITVNPLLKEILEMGGIRQELEQQITKLGLRKIEAIVKKSKQVERLLIHSEQIKMAIKYKSEQLKVAEASRVEKELIYRQLKNDSRYPEVQAAEEKKHQLQQQLNLLNYKITHFFNDLHLLQEERFNNISTKDFLLTYISDPSTALLQDKNLTILSVFDSIKVTLVSGQLEIEADEAQLLFSRLSQSTILKTWQTQYQTLKEELRQVNPPRVFQDHLARLEDVRYRLEHFTKKTEQSQKEICRLEEQLSKLQENLSREKKYLEDLIKIGLGTEMQIVV